MDIQNKYKILVNNKECLLAEVELYEYCESHPDIFTHRDVQQKEHLTWYFHKTGNSYKGGTYKGLDITLGDGNKYCGILIRSLYILDENKFIEGPCNCVNYLLKECDSESIEQLVNKMGKLDVLDNKYIKLVEYNGKYEIYKCPRVGITLSNKNQIEEKKKYVCKDYRFMIFPHLNKKGKNLIVCSMYHNGYNIDQIISITKTRKHICERYINEFEKGKNVDLNKLIGRKLDISEFCQMIGCIKAN